jgi:hypothetical protein
LAACPVDPHLGRGMASRIENKELPILIEQKQKLPKNIDIILVQNGASIVTISSLELIPLV